MQTADSIAQYTSFFIAKAPPLWMDLRDDIDRCTDEFRAFITILSRREKAIAYDQWFCTEWLQPHDGFEYQAHRLDLQSSAQL